MVQDISHMVFLIHENVFFVPPQKKLLKLHKFLITFRNIFNNEYYMSTLHLH